MCSWLKTPAKSLYLKITTPKFRLLSKAWNFKFCFKLNKNKQEEEDWIPSLLTIRLYKATIHSNSLTIRSKKSKIDFRRTVRISR